MLQKFQNRATKAVAKIKVVKLLYVVLLTVIMMSAAGSALAAKLPKVGDQRLDITTETEAVSAIDEVAGFLSNVFFALAAIFIILSAIFYLTAAGNQTQLDRAKNTLIYSIVAIVIALIAFSLPNFLGDILKR